MNDWRDFWSEDDEWLIESDDEFLIESARSQKKFEAGDRDVLLYFVDCCFRNNRPVPDWARKAFSAACQRVWWYEVKSWDEVFGRPLKKGEHLAAARRKVKLARDIWWEVKIRHDEGAGEPITKELFDSVGKKFKIGGTTAAEIYYWLENEEEEEEFQEQVKPIK
jgi:hypothetical protein